MICWIHVHFRRYKSHIFLIGFEFLILLCMALFLQNLYGVDIFLSPINNMTLQSKALFFIFFLYFVQFILCNLFCAIYFVFSYRCMNYKGKLIFLNEISWSYLRKLKTRGSGSINYSNRFVNILFVHKISFLSKLYFI